MKKKITLYSLAIVAILVVMVIIFIPRVGSQASTSTKVKVDKKVLSAKTSTNTEVKKANVKFVSKQNNQERTNSNKKIKLEKNKKEAEITNQKKLDNFNQQAVSNNFYIEKWDKSGKSAMTKATVKELQDLEKSSAKTIISLQVYEGKHVSVIEVES